MDKIIYFDNAATSWPKPPGVKEAMVHFLESIGANPGRSAHRQAVKSGRLVYSCREAVADLFSGPEDVHHVMVMLKLRELYRHLSNCADRGDEAANVIHDIVVKMT